jgi:hypothetical protein
VGFKSVEAEEGDPRGVADLEPHPQEQAHLAMVQSLRTYESVRNQPSHHRPTGTEAHTSTGWIIDNNPGRRHPIVLHRFLMIPCFISTEGDIQAWSVPARDTLWQGMLQ